MWNPAILPDWLNREFYIKCVVPAPAKVPKAKIRKALEVSEPYSIWIQSGPF
jgi:hypothetical protein